MERQQRQDRTHARAVYAGIAISVAVHAAALALIRFTLPAFDAGREHSVADASEAVPVPFEPAMQVVALREAPVVEAAASTSAVEAAASSAVTEQAEAPAATVAEAADVALAAAEVVDVPAAALPNAEPDAAPGGGDLPGEPAQAATVAEALEPSPAQDGEEEEEYALPPGVVMHVPGSVGRAKGGWGAAAGGNGDEERRGRVGVIRVGKCPPLPGRGHPPIMRPRSSHHLVHPVGW